MAWLPGLPDYGPGRQYLGGAVITDRLFGYGLHKRKQFAWTLSMVFAWFGLILYSLGILGMLTSYELQPKYVSVTLLVAVQIIILRSLDLRPPREPSRRTRTAA